MVWHILFEKKYIINPEKNIEDVVADYHAMSLELKTITHPTKPITELNQEEVNNYFLIPDKTPLSTVELYGKQCVSEAATEVTKCIGMITLDIRHFQGEKAKFEELEEIAKKYNLTHKRTYEEYFKGGKIQTR